MATAWLEFDLVRELEMLDAEAPPPTGRNAKTLVKYDDLRIVLIALSADTRIPEHRTEGRISVHVIRGRIRVRALERTFDLGVGGLLALGEGVAHDVEALDDSAFLLTIAWPGAHGNPARRERAGAR
jgi:quercetin dioxygenase-like cupin family protein